jgi:hypothetical protein
VLDGIAIAATVCALATAVWAFVETARHRPPTRPLFVALAVVAALVAVHVVGVVVRLIGGGGPTGAGHLATLIGYLLATVLVAPVGALLARLEPTRWGSALIGVACLVVPILLLRIGQVWHG